MIKYVKPDMKIVEYASADMIASSFSTSEGSKDDVVAGVCDKRGEWGDLWEEE